MIRPINEKTHSYLLPDGSTASDMKEARAKMGLGAKGFSALVRKGIVKKIQTTSKTSGYENREINSWDLFIW